VLFALLRAGEPDRMKSGRLLKSGSAGDDNSDVIELTRPERAHPP
jgi:hypothetical protein